MNHLKETIKAIPTGARVRAVYEGELVHSVGGAAWITSASVSYPGNVPSSGLISIEEISEPEQPAPKFTVGDRVSCCVVSHKAAYQPITKIMWLEVLQVWGYLHAGGYYCPEDHLTLAPLNVTTPPEPKFKVGDKVLIPNGENTAFTITKVQWSLGSLQWGYDGRDDALREAVTPLVLEAIVEGADAITFEHRDGCFSSDNCRCHEFVETLEEFLAVLREGSHE